MTTKLLTTKSVENDIDDIKTAAEILKNGGLVAIPTETVYGLAADATNESAVKNIYIAKGRPSDNPLIVHISCFDEWRPLVKKLDDRAIKLAEKYWPGPLTIILPKSDIVPDTTSGGLSTVAVRMPENEIARKIIELSCPLAAPSANLSGLPSPTTFEHVKQDMTGRIDAICDGGDCTVGVESTVISFAGKTPCVLRPGKITVEQIEDCIGYVDVSTACLKPLKDGETAASPGMKYKHYSPKADITVLKGTFKTFVNYLDRHPEFDAVMCFDGEEKYFPNKKTLSFGRQDDLLSQAEKLFTVLRTFDELFAKKVLCRAPYEHDEGLAVCNRLYRSAAFDIVTPPLPEKKVIGLTGPTGAGKGYISKMLCEKYNCVAIDSDDVVHGLYKSGSPLVKKLTDTFGCVTDENGDIDRKKLGGIVFGDKEKLEQLNSIVHPAVLRKTREIIDDYFDNGQCNVIVDAPLLFESGEDKMCDYIIAVTADRQTRLNRIMARDNIDVQTAEKRIDSQHDDGYYVYRADIQIKNQ